MSYAGLLDLSKIKNPSMVARFLMKKYELRFSKTPYKSDSLKKRTLVIPSAPSARKIVTPSLLKMQRGPPRVIQVTVKINS